MISTAILSLLAVATPQTAHDPVLANADGRTVCTATHSTGSAGKVGGGATVICRADRDAPVVEAKETDQREERRATGA